MQPEFCSYLETYWLFPAELIKQIEDHCYSTCNTQNSHKKCWRILDSNSQSVLHRVFGPAEIYARSFRPGARNIWGNDEVCYTVDHTFSLQGKEYMFCHYCSFFEKTFFSPRPSNVTVKTHYMELEQFESLLDPTKSYTE